MNGNLTAEELGALCICAERYALGRKTYMVNLICGIIKSHVEELEHNDICVLIRDIESPFMGDYGDECDKREWLNLLEVLHASV